MNHKSVFEKFRSTFPLDQMAFGDMEAWFPNGKNSIRIRDYDKNEFIFTYNSPKDWKFETVDSYLRK